MKKIAILGGGIGGVEAAISLRNQGFSVTLVSNREYLFIYPMSIWIPTREKTFEDVSLPLSDLAKVHGFELIIDEVVGINAKDSTFTLSKIGSVRYEYLIVALGSEKLYLEGMENTVSICGLPEDSIVIRDKIDMLLQKNGGKLTAGFTGNPIDVTGVRGEPAFEFIFNIHNFLKKQKKREAFELTFFAPMNSLGEKIADRTAGEFGRFFSKLKINTKLGENIVGFEQNGIRFENGSFLESDMTMFISGRCGHSVLKNSDLPLNPAGFVEIEDTCGVVGFDRVFAVGDIASIKGPDWRVKQGHLAEIMARNAAFNIFSMENGSDARRSYVEQINLIYMLDMGDSASLVYKDSKRDFLIPMPIIGHWIKKGWGRYYKLSRLNKIPRLPGA